MLIITSLLLLAAAAVLLAVFLGRPSIRSYAKEFGFSLDGIKEDVFVREHIDAFQDPATGFVVKLSGKVEGGDFDPARMTKGLSDAAKATVTFFNNDLKTAGKAPMQTLDDGTEYYFRRFVGSGGYAVFTVIYDSKTELYYICTGKGKSWYIEGRKEFLRDKGLQMDCYGKVLVGKVPR